VVEAVALGVGSIVGVLDAAPALVAGVVEALVSVEAVPACGELVACPEEVGEAASVVLAAVVAGVVVLVEAVPACGELVACPEVVEVAPVETVPSGLPTITERVAAAVFPAESIAL